MRTGRLALIAALLLGATSTGCAGISQRLSNVYDAAMIKSRENRELARLRQDTRDELFEERQEAMKIAAERDLQQARIDLERDRLEMQFCQANQEAQRQQLQRQIQDKIHSKVAFNVQHGLDVGELEVDMEELKQLIEQREQQQQQAPQQQQQGCGCEKRECGCAPGLQKGHCQRCRHRRCSECGKGCGGPAALLQAQTSPQRQPLRPAEIPLKLPVKLTFGMQNPQVEETQIRRQPVQQQQKPCDERCGACQKGYCTVHQRHDFGHSGHAAVSPPEPPPEPSER